MKKRVYVMAVMIAVLMSFSNLTVNAAGESETECSQ